MVRLILIGIVTLVVGGAVVGFVLMNEASPDGVPTAAGSRPLTQYLVSEHKSAAQAGESGRFDATTEETFRSNTGVWLGRQMDWLESVFAETSGVRFVGARLTQIPGPGNSVHVLIATEGGSFGSIFLQQYRATPELERNVAYSLPPTGLSEGAPPIVVYLPGGQIHYLVADDAETMAAMRSVLGVPETTKEYR